MTATEAVIRSLQNERDAWKESAEEQVAKLIEIANERDRLQYEVDAIPAIKAERDALAVAVNQGLLAMKSVQPVVANGAPHANVMAYNASIAAFEEALK